MASDTPSTPLPEQGGFNERLNTILASFEKGTISDMRTGMGVVDRRAKAKAAIRTLVLEVIGEDEKSKTTKPRQMLKYIGEDEDQIVLNGGSVQTVDYTADARNSLRAEQRKRLGS